MRTQPYWNAAAAVTYIGAVALFLNYLESFRANTPDTPLDSVGALSLIVFSAAVMAFLFFYKPVSLLIEGKKVEATSHFLKTLGTFGAITILILALVSQQ